MLLKYIRVFCLDLRKYRHYIVYSVKSNLKAELSNTVLGYFWWLLDPFLHMLVYTFLVMVIFKRGTPAYPVYIFSALLPWKVATQTLMRSTSSIRENAGIIKQVYLPKFILPLNIILTNAIKLLFGIIIILIMLFVYKIPLTWHLFEFFPVLIVFLLFFYSLSLFLTHFGVLFQDLRNLMNYIVLFWFFTSPGMWDINLIPPRLSKIIWINPNVSFFMSFRNVFMYGKSPYYNWLGLWLILSIILLIIGIPLLYKSDKNYTKVI